ncbi:cell division protein FtsQ/DivIB [Vibrio sp. SS-MA-C1-2]|uniref:cell division protein FtsQ/DivIB n=1 Tax=Vibrio sp. SS-MA-C1-2 TaxID=2908646 RepID=UPI001F457B00|nr:cell division protein FtsQ/DivIB [Vibrio sp. SS-MA-C1-2]UJF19611.1 cell division protein FtsQ/DivIB [Vibrio sp. SS-MA-C1-2]
MKRKVKADPKIESPISYRFHRLGFLFFLSVVAMVVFLGWRTVNWMTDANRLPLSKLLIQNQLHYTSESDIRYAISSLGGLGSFMTQNVDDIQSAIDQLPWVKQVSVRKQWPDKIKLYIREHQASAIWNDSALVSPDGTVFFGNAEDINDHSLVSFYGDDAQSEVILETWQKLSAIFAQDQLSISQVWLSPRYSWRVKLNNQIELELGRSQLVAKVERFMVLYPQLPNRQLIEHVDLRYDTGAAVKWLPDTDKK